MARPGSFRYPDELGAFQQVDGSLRNKARFIFDHEADPAHAKVIPVERVASLVGMLEQKASLIMDMQQARHAGTVEGLLETLDEESRAVVEQVQHVLDRSRARNETDEEADLQQYALLPLDKEKLVPFLETIGVHMDGFGFAWIVKPGHYFRISLHDTQVYLVSRADPDVACRVCIVQARKGAEANGAPTFNQNELLLLSKVVALLYDMLPSGLHQQIVKFEQLGCMGKNLFAFDPFEVFKEEYTSMYPELYKEHLEEVERRRCTGTITCTAFSSLRDEMVRELNRLKEALGYRGPRLG